LRASLEFPAEVAVSLIRTIQEALINVRKHAQVNEAVIRFQHKQGQARLRVEDKGRGFEFTGEDGSSFRLKIMHERMATIGGRLEVESALGQGTRMTLLYQGNV
jgi:signal transduction histidine kinase